MSETSTASTPPKRAGNPVLKRKLGLLIKNVLVPLVALAVFLLVWAAGASRVETSLGTLPGPKQVLEQSQVLVQEYQAERAKEAEYYVKLDEKVAQAKAEGMAQDNIDRIAARKYAGRPTFIDQIGTSLVTVLTGFVLASLIAIPVGILIGMNQSLYVALNPIIQLFKPVSPLAWLPLVTMIVAAVYVSKDPMFSKSFVISAITVSLCCLWPTIINTAVGVSSVSKDLINVAKVLRLGWLTKTRKIVLPSSMPMMFTGLRLSLGIAWMVLIAAEMLAQNPGLGKFVWDEFQNGSSNSLARIMVAVLVIGIIGFGLDRSMLMLQRKVSWDKNAILR